MYQKQLPNLYSHFHAQNVTPDLFLPDTWLTLFSRWLPFALLWEAFQLIEDEGFDGVLCLTAALLQAHSTALSETDDFTSLFVLLKALAKQPRQPEGHEIVAAARKLLPAASEALDEVRLRERTISVTTDISLRREGSIVIHEPTGLQILKQETSHDARKMAKVTKLAKGSSGENSESTPSTRTGRTSPGGTSSQSSSV